MAKDPVCGMDVNPETAAGSAEFEGVSYYFCSPGCREAFVAEPMRYLGGGTSESSDKGLLRRIFGRG